MRTRSKEPEDPFLVTGERWIDHRIMQRAMGNFYDHFVSENFEIDNSIGRWMENEDGVPIGGTHNEKIKESEWKNFIKRLQMAIVSEVLGEGDGGVVGHCSLCCCASCIRWVEYITEGREKDMKKHHIARMDKLA
jgi:hypothetical protein